MMCVRNADGPFDCACLRALSFPPPAAVETSLEAGGRARLLEWKWNVRGYVTRGTGSAMENARSRAQSKMRPLLAPASPCAPAHPCRYPITTRRYWVGQWKGGGGRGRKEAGTRREHRLHSTRSCGTIGGMKRVGHGRVHAALPQKNFPRAVASASARKSFEREMARLHGMSVEERIAEALSLDEAFSWLEPVVITRTRDS